MSPDNSLAPPEATLELLARFRGGDERAANALFEKYVRQLTTLVRKRMSSHLATRIDADDVVLSAYRSLFLRTRRGELRFEQTGDLWRLLVEVTLHKLYRQAKHHQAQRRGWEAEAAGIAIEDA